jgi:hypothetical protein
MSYFDFRRSQRTGSHAPQRRGPVHFQSAMVGVLGTR